MKINMPSPMSSPNNDSELKKFNVSIDNFSNQFKLQTSPTEFINKQPTSQIPLADQPTDLTMSTKNLQELEKPMAIESATESDTDQSSWHNSSIKYRRARLNLNLVPLKNLSLPQISRICDNSQTNSNNYSETNLNQLSSSSSSSLVAGGHFKTDDYFCHLINKTKYNPAQFSPIANINNDSLMTNGNKIIGDKNENIGDLFSTETFQYRIIDFNDTTNFNISHYDREESMRRLIRQDGVRINPELELEKQNWFHGLLSRDEAEEILSKENIGSYLVRRMQCYYTLSLRSIFGYMHFRIFHCCCYRVERWSLKSPHCFSSETALTNAIKCTDIEPEEEMEPFDPTIFCKGQFIDPTKYLQIENRLKKFPTIPKLIDYYTRNSLTVAGCEYLTLLYPVSVELL